jgi:archaellum component FlaF (FlaF/FlaG flagellin family)
METVISTLIVIALLILAIVGLSQVAMSSQASIAESAGLMQERTGDRARTNVTSLSAQTTPVDGTTDAVQITLKNSGSTKLSDFDQWDVILQYTDGTSNPVVQWYPTGNGTNQWNETIYLNASSQTAEVIEPGIFNPGEEMIVTIDVTPIVGAGSTNLAVISTPNGITASTVFTK